MKKQLFIPKKIKVGFNYREETYTKKLAYVIHYDTKGKLRKETSWTSWIELPGTKKSVKEYYGPGRYEYKISDKQIVLDETFTPRDIDNIPTEGFVLNKGVGGQRESYGWNARNEYIRVYDPRGFEFEISVANLLFILQETTSTQGKGLEGEFVYSWDGKDLVLLPVSSQDYKESSKFTSIQKNKVTKKDIEKGITYTSKQQETLIYLGRMNWYTLEHPKVDGRRDYNNTVLYETKKHVFYNVETKRFEPHTGFTKLATRDTDTCVDNYAELVDKFQKTKRGAKPIGIITKPTELAVKTNQSISDSININQLYMLVDGSYSQINIFHVTRNDIDFGYYINHNRYYEFSDSIPKRVYIRSNIWDVIYYPEKYKKELITLEQLKNIDFVEVFVKLDSGGEVLISEYL